MPLHQNGITLAVENRQGKYKNHQGNDPWWPAAKQWRFVHQANVIDGKTFIEPRKCYDRQGYNFPWRL